MERYYFFPMNWRKNIDPSIKNHLEAQINETIRNKKAYSIAKKPSEAQLWVAIANLSKQILDLNIKIKFLEQVMQETLKKPSSIIFPDLTPIKKVVKKKAVKRKAVKKK